MNEPARKMDDELTPDEILLGSLSYKGYSSRFEMWVLLIVMLAAAVLLAMLSTIGLILEALFYVLCVWPLYVRRARQMGAAGYGVLIIIVSALRTLVGLALAFMEGPQAAAGAMEGWGALPIILLLPLFIYGGPFSGRKSELMRAAIDGDLEQVKLLVEQKPEGVYQKSEKGYTAREYAEQLHHESVVDFLRAAEENIEKTK